MDDREISVSTRDWTVIAIPPEQRITGEVRIPKTEPIEPDRCSHGFIYPGLGTVTVKLHQEMTKENARWIADRIHEALPDSGIMLIQVGEYICGGGSLHCCWDNASAS